MKRLIACSALLLLPLTTLANDAPCKFGAPRSLQLDVGDASKVIFEVNQFDLQLRAGPAAAQLAGRACASTAELLDQLSISQQRRGDALVVTLQRTSNAGWKGKQYAWMDIAGTVPDNVLVQLKVGAGDASIENAKAVSVDGAAGDVTVRNTRGSVHAAIRAGDLRVEGAESVDLLSLGAGDATISRVARNVTIGRVAAGDLDITDVGGNLSVEAIASGDMDARQVRGNVEIGSIAVGDAELHDIGGNIVVDKLGVGDLDVDGAGGNLTVRSRAMGDVTHKGVRGNVSLPTRK